MDLVSFAFNAQAYYDPDKPLYINAENPTIYLSARQTKTLVKQLVAGLRAVGLRKDDAVMLCMPNNCFYIPLVLGIVGSGGVFCGANPAFHLDELVHIADTANPRLIICSKGVFPTIVEMCEKKGIPKKWVFVFDDISPPRQFRQSLSSSESNGEVERNESDAIGLVSDLQRYGESPWLTLHDETAARDSMAALFSTSGTTGLPKLARLSHYALVTQHLNLFESVPYDVVRLACLPLFHIFGAAWALFNPLRYGEPVYIMPRFFLDDYVSNISKYGITETYMAPPMVHELNRCGRPMHELLSTLRYVGVGGASIDAATMRQFRSYLQPGATVTPVWGMTEFGPAVLFRWGDQDDTGSIGRPLRGYETKIVDAAGGVIVEDNCPGELLVRTAAVMTGYVGIPMDDEDGWFRTGDIAETNDKKLYVVGRSKEMIKVKGWQVAPAELEATILQHADVSDCTVVGTLSADRVTELPLAYVVQRNDRKEISLAEEIYNLVRSRLVSYKKLEGGVVFVKNIPRTPSGKVQRFKLLQNKPDARIYRPVPG